MGMAQIEVTCTLGGLQSQQSQSTFGALCTSFSTLDTFFSLCTCHVHGMNSEFSYMQRDRF